LSLFITFEGIDGCGKTTQAKILAENLLSMNQKVVYTKEPGGTKLGISLRNILLNSSSGISPLTEFLLMASDRAEHVRKVIKPFLAKGYIVVCDRYADSSLAYQGAAGVNPDDIKLINAIATQGLEPDLTIFLDIDPDASLHIRKADRIEERDVEYFRKVREIYLEIEKANPARFKRVKVRGLGIEEVTMELNRLIQPYLNK
jgi:dTMP kinase